MFSAVFRLFSIFYWGDGSAQKILEFPLRDLNALPLRRIRPRIGPALRTPLSLAEALPIPVQIFEHRSALIQKYIDAPVVWIDTEPIPNDRAQAVNPCVHAGFSAYKSDALAVAVQLRFPRGLLDMLCPAFRFCVLNPADTSAEILWRSLCGAGTVPAAILAFFSCIDRKFFSTPRAYLPAVRFLHGAEITGTAAILFLIHTQRLPAAFAPQGLFLQGWICFPIVRPPLDTAGVAAETALCAGPPFRLKVFSAVRTDLNGRLIIRLPLFLPFLIMVQLPAAFSAKSPPAPGFAALLDRRPAFWAFIDRRVRVVPLRVVVPHPAFAAGEFLPRDVARWRKALPAVQACQLIRHDAFPRRVFLPFYHTGKGSRLFDAY